MKQMLRRRDRDDLGPGLAAGTGLDEPVRLLEHLESATKLAVSRLACLGQRLIGRLAIEPQSIFGFERTSFRYSAALSRYTSG